MLESLESIRENCTVKFPSLTFSPMFCTKLPLTLGTYLTFLDAKCSVLTEDPTTASLPFSSTSPFSDLISRIKSWEAKSKCSFSSMTEEAIDFQPLIGCQKKQSECLSSTWQTTGTNRSYSFAEAVGQTSFPLLGCCLPITLPALPLSAASSCIL